MFKISISIALLGVCGVLAQRSGPEFRQVVDDDSVAVGLNPKNFAVSNPELEQKFGWNSVSVDGDKVTIVTKDCQVIERDLDSLGDDERAELDKASQKLRQIPQSSGLKLNTDGGQALFAGQTTSNLNDFNKVSTTQDGKTIRQMGSGHYSIMDQNGGMPDDIKRVSVDGDQVTTVYQNGSVLMQPKSCVKGTQKQLINDAQSTLDMNKGVSEPLSYMQDPPMMPTYGNPSMMGPPQPIYYGNQPMMSPYGNPSMMQQYGNPSMNPSTTDPPMMQQGKLQQALLMDQLMKNQQMQMQNKLAMQQEELEFQQNMANRQRQQQIMEQEQILTRKQKQLELEEQMIKEQEQMHMLHMHQMYSSM